MTGKERVRRAFEHQSVDRVPVFPVVTPYLGSRVLGRPYRDFVLDPMLSFEALEAMIERLGFDGVEVGFGPARGWSRNVVVRDGQEFLADAQGNPVSRLELDDMPIPLVSHDGWMRDKRDLDNIKITPAEYYWEQGQLQAVERLVRSVGDRAFLAGVAAGQTMNTMVHWRGSQQAIFDLIDDPPFAHACMDRATDLSIEVGKALIQAGVDGIYMGDAWSSCSVISPALFREFCLPYYRKAAQAFQAMGAKVYLHICGNAVPILEDMAETGVDAIEPIDPLGGVEVADAKARVGGRVALKGGVNTLTLLNGTPDEVYEQSMACLKAGSPGSGYLLGSGDDIPRDAPLENIKAMAAAARDFGPVGGRREEGSV